MTNPTIPPSEIMPVEGASDQFEGAAATMGATQPGGPAGKPRSLGQDAWRALRKKPLFIISAALIIMFAIMSAFPTLFASADPLHQDLDRNLGGPIWSHWFKPGTDGQFGYDILGRDVYARTVHGARASIIVGLAVVLGNMLVGGLIGVLAGYYGKWIDAILSRLGDIFLGLPLLLGALVALSTFANPAADERPSAPAITIVVILVLVGLGWPAFARIMRGSVISTKQLDYVAAARALGAGPFRIIFRHVLPNAVAPLIVLSTISIGAYIGVEATLSFLGIGLRDPVISWGVTISGGIRFNRIAPGIMIFPGVFLTLAVLSFVMLGDAVRDALDPKLR